MGYKEKVLSTTEALTEWISANKDQDTSEHTNGIDWSELERIIANLNPPRWECENEACAVDTWTGVFANCPACNVAGKSVGRQFK